MFCCDWLEFLDAEEYKRMCDAMSAIKSLRSTRTVSGWIKLICTLLYRRSAFHDLINRGGFLTTAGFERWLNQRLIEGLRKNNPDFKPSGISDQVTFSDIPLPLKIIAADITTKKLRVFSLPHDAKESVASAVGASIAIPFIFHSKTHMEKVLVDGGIMSNFPAWVFDRERTEAGPLARTIGFRLVEGSQRPALSRGEPKAFSLLQHTKDVAVTAAFGDNTLETRQVGPLYEVPLRVDTGPLDFNIDNEKKTAVYNQAYRDSIDFYRNSGNAYPLSTQAMQKRLGMIELVVRRYIGHDGHLRLNLMLPVTDRKLEVAYTHNMDSDDDCDDRMVFGFGSGACGKCWEELQCIVCNLRDAKRCYADIWKMDKRLQRLVRTSLSSLLSVPLFRSHGFKSIESTVEARQSHFLGVLNIDSDEEIIDELQSLVDNEDSPLETCTKMIVDSLTRK